MTRSTRRMLPDAADDSPVPRHVVTQAVAAQDDDVELLLDAVVDYLDRMRRATLALQIALRRDDLRRAARIGAQLAALARMAESRLTVAAERRHAVLTLASAVLDEPPT